MVNNRELLSGCYMSVSKRTLAIKPSATLAISALAKQMQSDGKPVVSLSAGEPDFTTPETICSQGIEAIKQGHTHYTAVPGTLPLREAICTKLMRDNNLSYKPDDIIVSNGAKQSIFNVIAATIDPNDEVIIPVPYWVSYPDMVKLNDGIPVYCKPQSGLKPTAEDIEACITEKTKLLILNSPNNPAGYTIEPNELSKIANMLIKYPNIIILSDDIYEYLTWTESGFANIVMTNPELKDRTIIINGASKGYAMTGWRIGYTATSNTAINKAMKTYQSQTTSCPSSISQYATIKAMQTQKSELANMLDKYRARHDLLFKGLSSIPGVKAQVCEGAFYSFPDFSDYIAKLGLQDDIELSNYLLQKAYLACVPGSAFGAPNHLRLSFATSEENITIALERLNAQIR